MATTGDDLLDHPLIAERYFFPRSGSPRARLDVDVDGAVLACALHRGDPEGHTVVHFHGNGEVVADWQQGFDGAVQGMGWDLLLAEYRGYGGSTGVPRLGRMLDDVEAIMRAAGPPERLVVFGRSVGSIFALEAVARFPGVAGLILESAIADPLERLLLRVDPRELGVDQAAFEAAVAARLDHRSKIGRYRGPVLVLHSRHDGLVEVSHAERLAAWAGGTATLRIFEEGDHNSILAANPEAYLEAVGEFLAGLSLAGKALTGKALAAEPPAAVARTVSRAGIPYRPDDATAGPTELVSAIRARRAGGKLLNLDRMLLNSPAFAQAWNTMFGTIRNKLSLPPRLRELAIMSVGAINRAEYEWGQHEPEFLKAGGTRAQLAALREPVAALADAAHFDEAERATLALTHEMTTAVAVSGATMRRVRAALPDDQVVELIGTIAGYNMVSRFVVATGVELE